LKVLHRTFRHIFEGLETRYQKELSIIRKQFPSAPVKFSEKPLVVNWKEGIRMLNAAGHNVSFLSVMQSSSSFSCMSR
jgi:hypothetical protein